MAQASRLAVVQAQPAGAAADTVLLGILEMLRAGGWHVQTFASRACGDQRDLTAVSGAKARHLDSWLMSPESSREVFLRGAEGSDLGLVAGAAGLSEPGGTIEKLIDWLDLPVLRVVDLADSGRCQSVPPPRADGLVLCGVSADDAVYRSVDLEALAGMPVVGTLPTPLIEQTKSAARSASNRRELARQLGRGWNWPAFRRLLARRELGAGRPAFCPIVPRRAVNVALAYDEAFDGYFPDVLDAIEACGGRIHDFSPLHDETLPDDSDILYFGSGRIERYGGALARNQCMKLAVRRQVMSGGRVYAEGRGLSYLCNQLRTPEGELHRMVGLFPATAEMTAAEPDWQPTEIALGRTAWFGDRGVPLRGYRDGGLSLLTIGRLHGCGEPTSRRYHVVECDHAVGCQMSIHFGAQPHLLQGFFAPLSQLRVPDPWIH